MTMTAEQETLNQLPVLEVRDLTVRFGGNAALDHFELKLNAKENVGLIGPNGAGKSTCVNAITGYVKCRGEVSLGGVRIDSLPPYKRARAGLVRTFQSPELFVTMTVEENIEFGARVGIAGPRISKIARKSVNRTLEILNLTEHRDKQISTLAFGTRKVVELGRAIAGVPKVLLLDEPMAGLDTSEKSHFIEVLKGVFAEIDSAILLIEHDMFAVEELTNRVYVLDGGCLIASGSFQEVTSQDIVIEAYLGASDVV